MNRSRIKQHILMASVALITVSAIVGLLLSCGRNGPSGPNVIIILSDALRSDHLGCYGYERDTSPYIDAFAKDATVFKNAFAQSPSTKPSVTSLFTSKYPTQHKAIYIYARNQALPSISSGPVEVRNLC